MTEPVAAARRSLLPVTLVVAAVVLLVDQLTKHWAVTHLDPDVPQHVIWTLQWNLSFNSGMAFSKGQGLGPIIGLVAIIVVVVIVLSVRTNASRMVAVAAGLVMGGALGNLADRIFRGDGWLHGAVVDFIDFQWFPIFNVADICVNVGGAIFIIWSLFAGRGEGTPA
ncbi:MAG: signal peptidase [Actinomycetota bacterium]|jgi:signal peptidase II